MSTQNVQRLSIEIAAWLRYTIIYIAILGGYDCRQAMEVFAMKPVLTINELIESARCFCEIESRKKQCVTMAVTIRKNYCP